MGFPWGKPAVTELRYSTYSTCWVIQYLHNPQNSDMNCEIFNMYADVNACDCTPGYTDTARESALKVDSRRKIPCCTRESNLHWRRADPMLYQLSYISSLHVTHQETLIQSSQLPVSLD